jgi:hypothetical protein
MDKNNKKEFVVIFKGDIGYLDSDILISNLLTTTNIIQEINKELGGKEINISIKPFAPGSFEVLYAIAHVGVVSGLFNAIANTNIDNLNFILKILGDILNIKKILSGKKPTSIVENGNKVTVSNVRGD